MILANVSQPGVAIVTVPHDSRQGVDNNPGE
jgi:hypothetical protein